MMKNNETVRSTFAQDMHISPEVVKTVADVTFKSVSNLETRRAIAKEYRRALQKSKELGLAREAEKEKQKRDHS